MRGDSHFVPAARLLDLLSAPTTDSLASLDRPMNVQEVAAHEVELYNANRHTYETPTGEERPVLDALGEVCDAELEKGIPDTLDEADELIIACAVPLRRIDCEDDAPPNARCEETEGWYERLVEASEKLRDFPLRTRRRVHYQLSRRNNGGNDPDFWEVIAPVVPKIEAPFSINDAVLHLAWQKKQDRTPNPWAVDAIKDYSDVPGYEREGSDVADGYFLLAHHGEVESEEELKGHIQRLYEDGSFDLYGHLAIEALIYDLDWWDLF